MLGYPVGDAGYLSFFLVYVLKNVVTGIAWI